MELPTRTVPVGFNKNKIDRVKIDQNSELIYYMYDEDLNLIGIDKYSPKRCSCSANLLINPVALNIAYITKAHK